MEQRLLRLGDIVDDYCPKERRITNHAVVAIVDDAIRQTRCTTCDTEHVFKHGKEPRKRRKDEPATAFEEVLSEVTAGQLVSPRPPVSPDDPAATPATMDAASQTDVPSDADEADVLQPEPPSHTDTWLAHRQLIRATLPRTEGEQPPPRPIPEFTMHQRPSGRPGFRHASGRDGNFGGGDFRRQGRYGGSGNGNGNMNGNGNGNGPEPNGNRQGKSGRRRHRHKRPR